MTARRCRKTLTYAHRTKFRRVETKEPSARTISSLAHVGRVVRRIVPCRGRGLRHRAQLQTTHLPNARVGNQTFARKRPDGRSLETEPGGFHHNLTWPSHC